MKCTHCTNEVKPVVCLDIDGTLADYHVHFLTFAGEYLGRFVDPYRYRGRTNMADFLNVSKETYRQVKLAFRQGGMKRTMPRFSFSAQLTHAIRNQGVELWITTTRPYMRLDNVDPDTREWLSRNMIRYDHLFYDDDKYGKLLNSVDHERIVCVVDDEREQVARAAKLGLTPIWRRNWSNRMATSPSIPDGTVQVDTLEAARRTISAWVDIWKANHDQ